MNDIYVFDNNLNQIGIIDTYKSCIWDKKYKEIGQCELYIEATQDKLELCKKGYYLVRLDDDMVCQIKQIEIDTDVENGNYLIITGYDVKSFLDQRIVWGTMNCDGNIEDFIRNMVNKTLINPNLSARRLTKADGSNLLNLGNKANFDEVTTEQISYKNVGEKTREYCNSNNWGYKVVLNNNAFWFLLYKGVDRSNYVVFSNDYENLAATKYNENDTNLGNVALVGGQGEGSERSRNVSGYAEGINRYEIFVDAKDISKNITWEELTNMYPTTDNGGQGYITTENGSYVYKMNYINIQIVDDDQLSNLKTNFPDGTEITVDGYVYYQVYNEVIADLPSNTLESNTDVVLRDLVYSVYLLNRGNEKLAEYGGTISFEGTVQPNVTFIYKKDYNLGDLVTVENEYGISVVARIVEVTEVNDDNGYSIEPKFEYMVENRGGDKYEKH